MNQYSRPLWATQPPDSTPIDLGASINRGLALLVPVGPSGRFQELVTGKNGTPTGLASRNATRFGTYPKFGTSDYLDLTLPAGISGTTPITIAFTYRQTAQTDAYPVILAWKPTGAANQFLVTVGPTASYFFAVGPRDGASSASEFGAAASPMNVDRACLITLTAGTDSATRSTRRLWINGVHQPEITSTSFGLDSGAGFRLGKNYTLSNYFEGSIGNFHIWNRVLTDGEARAWTLNPFMTRQPTRRRFWPSVVGGGTPVGLSTETDTALALAALQRSAVGVATETDVALALVATQRLVVGLSTETDTALALAPVQKTLVGLAADIETALALLGGAGGPVGLAVETDIALALTGLQKRVVGLAAETDVALALLQTTPVGLAAETDVALALAGLQKRVVGLAQELDSALQLYPPGVAPIPPSFEWIKPRPSIAQRQDGERMLLVYENDTDETPIGALRSNGALIEITRVLVMPSFRYCAITEYGEVLILI